MPADSAYIYVYITLLNNKDTTSKKTALQFQYYFCSKYTPKNDQKSC